MSIPVDLENLPDALARYRFSYLLTTSENGPPHAVQVTALRQGSDLVITSIGRRTRENALARPAVSLLCPPQSEDGYSLIVDGQAVLVGESLRITPMRAILHRSNPHSTPQAARNCGSDCVEVDLTPRSTRAR